MNDSKRNSFFSIFSKRKSIVSLSQTERTSFRSVQSQSLLSTKNTEEEKEKRNLTEKSVRETSSYIYNSPTNNEFAVTPLILDTEIHALVPEERCSILQKIQKYKNFQYKESQRKQMLLNQINEIKAIRPSIYDPNPNMCYICHEKFCPCFSRIKNCCRCDMFVCQSCIKLYSAGFVCSKCVSELLYKSRRGSIFYKDFDDGITINVIEIMISKIPEPEVQLDIPKDSQENADAISLKSKSDSSISGRSLLKMLMKRKSGSSTHSSYSSSQKGNLDHDTDGKSYASMSISNTKLETIETARHESIEGEVLIGLSYIFNKKVFKVIVKKCRDLMVVLKKENTSNPYVKVILLPEITGDPIHKTKVKVGNINPIYNEQCKFKNIMFDEIVSRSVMITVFHKETIGKDIFMGHTCIQLNTYSFENATAIWYKLEDRREVVIPPLLSKYLGDIVFSIKYTENLDQQSVEEFRSESQTNNNQNFASGCIQLWVIQANNLFSSKYDQLPSSYVKCILVSKNVREVKRHHESKNNRHSKHSQNIEISQDIKIPMETKITQEAKKKTHIIPKSFNPIWNIQYLFPDISKENLKTYGMELTVWDKKNNFIPDVLLGGIEMNISRNNKPVNLIETEVWNKMIEKPETWIEGKMIIRTDIR